MVNSIKDSQSSNILAALTPQQATPSGSADSFTAQLTSALEGAQARSGENSNRKIDIPAAQSRDSGVRQFLATAENPDSPAAPAAPAAPTDGSGATFFGFVASPASASASTTATTTTDTSGSPSANATPPATTMTEVDAYWAAQPPAVQELRNITDISDRGAMAQDLANQGYTIDKAIMVWGWDPLKTMLTREMYGYTWAPNLNQGNVPTPGLTLPGQTSYDPKNPMPGSIAVNTDFAKGTTITDPWSASQLKANT